jgi:hypothetical protein
LFPTDEQTAGPEARRDRFRAFHPPPAAVPVPPGGSGKHPRFSVWRCGDRTSGGNNGGVRNSSSDPDPGCRQRKTKQSPCARTTSCVQPELPIATRAGIAGRSTSETPHEGNRSRPREGDSHKFPGNCSAVLFEHIGCRLKNRGKIEPVPGS